MNSEEIKQLKENIMFGIFNNNVPLTLEELKQHNKRIDEAIEQIKRGEAKIKELK